MKKNSKATKAIQHDHPGRPRYKMDFPKSAEWTFTQLMEANGVDTRQKLSNGRANDDFGKGPNCTMLTLRKNMEADMYLHKQGKPLISKWRTRVNARSQVVLIDGVTAEPDSASGLGRRALLYRLRSVPAKVHAKPVKTVKAPKVKATRKPRTPKTDKGGLSEGTKTYEAIKDILATPTPAVTIAPVPATPAPVIPTAPVETVPAPAPEAPAAAVETPAPVAPEAAPALTPVSAASLAS